MKIRLRLSLIRTSSKDRAMYLKTAGLRSFKENRTNIAVCGPNKSVEVMEFNSVEKSHSKPPAIARNPHGEIDTGSVEASHPKYTL